MAKNTVVTNGVARPDTDAANAAKKAVVILDNQLKRKSCKGVVRFAVKDGVRQAITDNIYVDRLTASQLLGVPDLDDPKLLGMKVTIEPIYA